MTFAVVLAEAARLDLDDAALWYERQKPGPGAAFLSEVDHAVGLAAERPLRFAVVHRDVRCVRLRRFPNAVFFRTDRTAIVVIAVFHARGEPIRWRERS